MAGEHNNMPMNSCGLCLKYPANWPLVAFLGVLALLHLGIAMIAYSARPAEAQICLLVGSFFAGAALLAGLMHHELVIRPDRGCLSMCRSLGFLRLERKVPFDQVQSVRLTFTPSTSMEKPRIDVLCGGRAIASPMTLVPRQQALCMAMLMNVELIRIYSRQEPCLAHRMDESGNHESVKGDPFRTEENKGDDNLAA
jgi:hypothetical protein